MQIDLSNAPHSVGRMSVETYYTLYIFCTNYITAG